MMFDSHSTLTSQTLVRSRNFFNAYCKEFLCDWKENEKNAIFNAMSPTLRSEEIKAYVKDEWNKAKKKRAQQPTPPRGDGLHRRPVPNVQTDGGKGTPSFPQTFVPLPQRVAGTPQLKTNSDLNRTLPIPVNSPFAYPSLVCHPSDNEEAKNPEAVLPTHTFAPSPLSAPSELKFIPVDNEEQCKNAYTAMVAAHKQNVDKFIQAHEKSQAVPGLATIFNKQINFHDNKKVYFCEPTRIRFASFQMIVYKDGQKRRVLIVEDYFNVLYKNSNLFFTPNTTYDCTLTDFRA
jgi:hypothetical protein